MEASYIAEIALELNCPESCFYDAQGQSIDKIRDEMKSLGKIVAFNARLCYRGHRLRDRSNHCVVCNPRSLKLYLNKDNPGNLYIFGNQKYRAIKVGFTTEDIDIRLSKYISRSMHSGWEWLVFVPTNKAWSLEIDIHRRLSAFRLDNFYLVDGELAEKEIYRLSAKEAIDLFMETIPGLQLEPKKIIFNTSIKLDDYCF